LLNFISTRVGDVRNHDLSFLILNALAFLIASSGAFFSRNDMLLPGLDGEFTRNATTELFRFSDPRPVLPFANFEAMGTLNAFNPLLSPSLLPIPLFGEAVGVPVGFLVCATLVFISTYALGRALRLTRGVALLASWALPPLCLPYQTWINLYLTYNLNPVAGDTVSFTMLALVLLIRGYQSPRPYWYALGLLGFVFWIVLANPLWIVLLLPTIGPIGLGIVLGEMHRADFLRRTAWLLLPSVVFLAFGGVPYLLGLYTDTAVAFFSQEMNKAIARSLRMLSVATATGQGLHKIGAPWVALAIVGLVLALRRGGRSLRVPAYSILAAMFLYAVYCGAYLLTPTWTLPYPIYFEFFLWPFYALLAAYAFVEFGRYLQPRLEALEWYARVRNRLDVELREPGRFLGAWLLASFLLAGWFALTPFSVWPNLFFHPPRATAITKTLAAEVGTAPHAPFKGYVANMTGVHGLDGPPTGWYELLHDNNDSFIAFRNTHRIPYLWRYGVPMLEGYSQNIEPAIYGLVTRLLNRPDDVQVRTITFISRLDFPLMQSLGLRFIVADFLMPPPAQLRIEVAAERMKHQLFELPDPNTGNYSPTDVVVASNATDVLRRLAAPNFKFRKTVILDSPLQLTLVPAERSQASLIPNGWRIRASSAATSMLLLPLQFSNCLSISEHQGGAGKVTSIRRANLASTALIFEGTVDVSLTLQVTPFWNPYCRLRDAREMRDFGLQDVPRAVVPPRTPDKT